MPNKVEIIFHTTAYTTAHTFSLCMSI